MSQADQTFISYSRADSEFALRLANDLRAAGVHIWMDQLDITPGERWDREVELGLKTCRRMLIIISAASSKSENVQDEIGYAMQQNKLIIPVLHQVCDIPFRLQRLQYIDFTQDYARGLRQLLPAMEGTDAEVVKITGNFKRPEFNPPPPVTPPQITSSEPAPKPASAFRKGLAVGGGAVVLLLLLLVIWAANSDSTTPEGQAAASASKPAESPQATAATKQTGLPKEHPCEIEKSLRSGNNGATDSITFTNKRSEPIKIFWLDNNGKRSLPTSLKQDEEVEIDASNSDFWVITSRSGACIKILEGHGSAIIE